MADPDEQRRASQRETPSQADTPSGGGQADKGTPRLKDWLTASLQKKQAAIPDEGGPSTSVEFDQMLKFLGLESADQVRLRSLLAQFRSHSAEFVESFYSQLYAFPQTAQFLTNPGMVERLKAAQWRHFESLLDGQWDASFVQSRERVGELHAQIGIGPHLFLGAYNQYLQYFLPLFAQAGPESTDDPAAPKNLAAVLSLTKVMMLDIGLTLESYFKHMTQSLQMALEMYLHANQELRNFARLTTHDLKTPLSTVSNLCEEVLDEFGEQLPAAARSLIEQARQRTFRMSGLIDELLSHVVAEGSSRSVRYVESGPIIKEVLDTLKEALRKKKIQVDLPMKFPAVMSNAVMLREVFANLLSNAVKFIEASPGSIKISIRSAGRLARFTVTDSGTGIPAEELERIFVPFRRLPAHRHVPGSGLGLYFAKSIVESLGGRIWAESKLGAGSSFHVELPLCENDELTLTDDE